ncbi:MULTISPECIES: hypothetical protein [Flavobacterium]|uniref:Prenyltransferase n=1 Tax=Flavobacterium columnare TaxID=996 RepID=A0AA94F064_9FLAO|nr:MULTISPECIES: hypothetical protein [Flavobacterium]MCH4829168.1 hypothetical protein [Flavobacterium columnare]MCH4833945.1 hypothetical protein [Flavobacterium columnare]QYS91483.1 hypothetical protein JJC04_01235 [Flavobacterium covae]
MSRFLKNIFDFYINSSIHVALAVFAFVQISCIEFHISNTNNVREFAFYGTIVGYNFIKYYELTRVRKQVWHKQLKWIVSLSFVSVLCCGYYFFQLNQITQIIAIGALLLTGFYTLPIVPKKTNFRNWSGVKIYLVALSWAIVTVWLPIFNTELVIKYDVVFYFIQRFFVVFVLMLIFEIVDLSKDKLSLQTIPQQIGVRQTKWLGYVLLVICVLLEVFKFNSNGNFNNQLVALQLILPFFIAIALFFATPDRSKYYTSFWVEAIPIVCWVLCLIQLKNY